MGISNFRIVFNQHDSIYYPGQMVSGIVSFNLNKPKKIRGVELKLKGRAKCKWTEQESYQDSDGKTHHRTVTREGKEKFFSNEIKLNGGKGEFELPIGDYSYPFSVMLPHNAPSTYNGEYGGIHYSAKAKIDIPWATDDVKKEFFIVINVLNLNNFPALKNPHKDEKNKTFCCLCCTSGPLSIVVHVPKTGFGKNEAIPVTLEVDNASNVGIHDVKVYIKRKIDWIASNDRKHTTENLKKKSFGAVDEHKSQTWSENVEIPNISYPNIDGCSVIKMRHELHIEADAEGMHSDLDIHIPIVIGDIAIGENESTFTPPVQYPTSQGYPLPVQPNVPYAPQSYPPPPGVNVGMPPPNPSYPGFNAQGVPPNPVAPGYPGQVPVNPGYPGAVGYPDQVSGNPGYPDSAGYPGQVPVNPGYPTQPPVNPECATINNENHVNQFTPLLPVNPSAPPSD